MNISNGLCIRTSLTVSGLCGVRAVRGVGRCQRIWFPGLAWPAVFDQEGALGVENEESIDFSDEIGQGAGQGSAERCP
jgi:hypothetical protein